MDPRDTMSILRCLRVPTSMIDRREEFVRAVVHAQSIIDEFARQHGWQIEAATPLFECVEIFGSQAEIWDRVRELEGLPADVPVPSDGFAAAVINDVLLAVTPECYAALRPEYVAAEQSWVRLLAHELAHRLHVRIAGSDENMGPRWFYEGFASLAANARLHPTEITTLEEACAAIRAEGRGSYALYERAVRYFARRLSLPKLIKRAARTDFEQWLCSRRGESGE